MSGGPPGGDRRGRTPADAGMDGVVLHLRDVAGRRSSELELERLAYTDYLTGLPNRARLMAALSSARARVAGGVRRPACCCSTSTASSRSTTSPATRPATTLLVEVAARLRATVRDGDLVGRLGGDEFAVLVRDGIEEATALAERIVADLRGLHPVHGSDGFTDSGGGLRRLRQRRCHRARPGGGRVHDHPPGRPRAARGQGGGQELRPDGGSCHRQRRPAGGPGWPAT